MEQFRKLDISSGKLILDKKYAFAFTHNDGFTGRLLKAEFVVSWNYEYSLELNAFSFVQKKESYLETGILSDKLLFHFESLINSDYKSLKEHFTHQAISIDDIGQQQYLINMESPTMNIYIVNGAPKEYFNTYSEQKLYDLNEYLKKWVENTYKDWASK